MTSNTLSKLPNAVNPPQPWQGAMYRPSETLGTPIGALIQQYLPPKRAHFPLLLSKRVRTTNTLSKLPIAPFLLSTHLKVARGHVSAIWDPGDPHWSLIKQYLAPKRAHFP